MRLWLARSFRLLRHQGSTPFAKDALAECAKSDANRRVCSSFYAASLPAAVQKKRSSPGANGIVSPCAAEALLLLKSSYNLVLVFLRTYRDGVRGWRPREESKQVVAVSSEAWRLLNEYDVTNTFRHVFNVHIQATPTTSKEVQLTLRGSKASEVAAMLADPPRKLDVPDKVGLWLIGKGPNGLRVKDILNRSGALIKLSRDIKTVLLVGSSKATVEAKRVIDECDCVEEFDIDNFVGFYLINDGAYHQKRLGVETDVVISCLPVLGATKWKAVVVGPTGSVKCLRNRLDGLHIKLLRIPQGVCWWLTNPGKRVGYARGVDLNRKFNTNIHIVGSLTDDNDPVRLVELVVVAESEADLDAVLTKIDECDCIEEFDIDNFVGFYLIGNDSFHQKRLAVEADAFLSAKPVVGATKWRAVVGGPTESVKRLRNKLDGLHVERHRITHAARSWLNHSGKPLEGARTLALDRKFETQIHLPPITDGIEPARMVDLVVVGESKRNVADVLAIIDELHIEHTQVPQAVCRWLTNTSKGARCARGIELNRKFDTHLQMGPLGDDPACVVDLAVVGERKENVAQVVATVGSIAVEKVSATKLQFEFWFGHTGEEQRHRPHHKLEIATGTCIVRDGGAGCVHVAGRPDSVREALKEISKTQHIALRTSVVSFAMANYIKRARRAHEIVECQLRLTVEGMQPGTWELRRLHRVNSEGDEAEADKADEVLMRNLDLDEVVLEVPAWAQFLVRQCRELEKSTETGIHFSTDVIEGRVLVAIAGSRSTVKRGMKELIRRIECHAKYKEGDVCLRHIQGESVHTDGFKKVEDAKPSDTSRCREPFDWERLTRVRWCYVGAPRAVRPPRRPRQPSV